MSAQPLTADEIGNRLAPLPTPSPHAQLGTDVFADRTPPPAPAFTSGYNYSELHADKRAAFFDLIDMTKPQPTAQQLKPGRLPANSGTIITGREVHRSNAPTLFKPGRSKNQKVPKIVHSIWMGGPLTDQAFLRNVSEAATNTLNPGYRFVLWTDVTRAEIAAAQAEIAAAREGAVSARSRRVADMVSWAETAGVRLVNIDEVFTADAPMRFDQETRSERGQRSGPRYAAASDILRLEILNRFGGVYVDGDNVITTNLDQVLRDTANDPHGLAIGRTGQSLTNSTLIAAAGSAGIQAYLDAVGANDRKTVAELFLATSDEARLEMRRHNDIRGEIVRRTGPNYPLFEDVAERLGIPPEYGRRRDKLTPVPSEVVGVNSDKTWLSSAPPPLLDERTVTDAVKGAVQSLHRDHPARDGTVHLPVAERIIAKLPPAQRPAAWAETTRLFLGSRPGGVVQINVIDAPRSVVDRLSAAFPGSTVVQLKPRTIDDEPDPSASQPAESSPEPAESSTAPAESGNQPPESPDTRGEPGDRPAGEAGRRPAPPADQSPEPSPAPAASPAPSNQAGPVRPLHGPQHDKYWERADDRTASWFVRDNPLPPRAWESLRNKEQVQVRTVSFDPVDMLREADQKKPDFISGTVRYDVRLMEVQPNRFVQEYTVRIHLDPTPSVTPDQLRQVKDGAKLAVDRLYNQGYRLPSGPQFHLRIEFVDHAEDAHVSVQVANVDYADEGLWGTVPPPVTYAHEIGHYLGLPDEYRDGKRDQRVFNSGGPHRVVHRDADGNRQVRHEPRWNSVRLGDDGLMSNTRQSTPVILPRHLWHIDRMTTSQVHLPETDYATLHAPGAEAQRPPATFGAIAREFDRVRSSPNPDWMSYLDMLDAAAPQLAEIDPHALAEHRRDVDVQRIRSAAAAGEVIPVRGTTARLVPGVDGFRLVGAAVTAALAADLAAITGWDVVALVVGADAEEPRTLRFPPRGRPLPG